MTLSNKDRQRVTWKRVFRYNRSCRYPVPFRASCYFPLLHQIWTFNPDAILHKNYLTMDPSNTVKYHYAWNSVTSSKCFENDFQPLPTIWRNVFDKVCKLIVNGIQFLLNTECSMVYLNNKYDNPSIYPSDRVQPERQINGQTNWIYKPFSISLERDKNVHSLKSFFYQLYSLLNNYKL